jgi:integrase
LVRIAFKSFFGGFLIVADRISVKKFPGVFFRESLKRLYNGKPDKSYCFSYENNGKQCWKTVGWASHGISAAYANQVRIDTLNKLNNGDVPNPAKRQRLTVGAAIAKYFTWAESEGKDLRVNKNIYKNHIEPHLSTIPIDFLSLEMLDKFKINLSANLAPASVKHVLIVIQKSINFCIKRKHWTGVNPASSKADFSLPALDNKGERFFTPEEAYRLLDHLAVRDPLWFDISLISLHTGLRLTEIFSLKGADINVEAKIALIKPKFGRREPVLLTDESLKILVSRRGLPDELIFKNLNGLKFNHAGFNFKAAVNACGLNDGITDSRQRVWFHTWRHTFASWLAQAGVDIFSIMKLMRHKTITMSMRYAHLIPDRQREYLDVIQRNLQAAGQSSPPDHQQ